MSKDYSPCQEQNTGGKWDLGKKPAKVVNTQEWLSRRHTNEETWRSKGKGPGIAGSVDCSHKHSCKKRGDPAVRGDTRSGMTSAFSQVTVKFWTDRRGVQRVQKCFRARV